MAVAEAGGDDYEDADEEWIVYTSPSDLMAVKKAIEEQGVQVKGAELTMIPSTPTEVSVADARRSCASSIASKSWRTSRTSITRWTSPTKSPRLWKKNSPVDYSFPI